ncbi:MAG: aminotransferase class I/II-fold pyridoxal phosphate-dependent enzyme [Hungatella sp.]|jgi:cystathionine beta-lyase|nr:aminotransferase class I/II-fold pyridoxal phosphate-dependent enzyme [Hungatella sp.]
MKYDFTSIMNRHGMDSIAVDNPGQMPGAPGGPKEGFDIIPMWVADMNFPTVPTVCQALAKRASHPAFGYFGLSDAYYDGIIHWQETRNQVKGLRKEHIGYENGVLGCVVSAAQAFCSCGDKILVHAPTYIGFTGSLTNAGYHLILSQLVQDKDGIWRMDYEDMDQKLKEHSIHFAVFCSPHNPTGRVWEPWEIEKAMEVYKANDCVVVSDEIWADILLDGHKHTPTQSVSEDAKNRTIAIYAPSKTFNLAGLVGSYHIVYNKYLRDRLRKQSSLSHYNSQNVMSMHALIGAYSEEGQEWVDELCQVLSANVDFAYNYILSNFKGISLTKPQGTYMLYLDCSSWCQEHHKTLDELLRAGWDVGVIWQDGRPFNKPYTIRMNLALPLSRVEEAMKRLSRYVFSVS